MKKTLNEWPQYRKLIITISHLFVFVWINHLNQTSKYVKICNALIIFSKIVVKVKNSMEIINKITLPHKSKIETCNNFVLTCLQDI
jgi:uncharacterized membrane protein